MATPAMAEAKLKPRDVARQCLVSPKAVIRWIHCGLVSPSGERVSLVALRFGRRYMIRQKDLDAFLQIVSRPTIADNGRQSRPGIAPTT